MFVLERIDKRFQSETPESIVERLISDHPFDKYYFTIVRLYTPLSVYEALSEREKYSSVAAVTGNKDIDHVYNKEGMLRWVRVGEAVGTGEYFKSNPNTVESYFVIANQLDMGGENTSLVGKVVYQKIAVPRH